jgi:hypothetical protein
MVEQGQEVNYSVGANQTMFSSENLSPEIRRNQILLRSASHRKRDISESCGWLKREA